MFSLLRRALFLCVALTALSSHAQILEKEGYLGADALGNHVLITNPALIYAKSSTDWLFMMVQKKNTVSTNASVGGQGSLKQPIDVNDRAYGGGGIFNFGRNMFLGFNLQINTHTNTGKHTNGRFDAKDEIEQKFLKFMLTFALSDNIRIGTLARFGIVDATIMGSYWIPESQNISYGGQVTGEGLGVLLGSLQNGLSFAHITPMRGKMKIEGESVLISEHGVYMVEFHFQPSQALSLGLGARYYPQQKGSGDNWRDGRNETRETADEMTYFPRGIYHEEDVYTLGIGFKKKTSESYRLSFGFSHTYLYAFVPFIGGDVGSTFVRRNKIKLGLGGNFRQIDWNAFAAASKSTKEFKGPEGTADYSSVENIFGGELVF